MVTLMLLMCGAGEPLPRPDFLPAPDFLPPPMFAPSLPRLTVTVTKTRVPSGYPVRAMWWTGCDNWQHMATASKHAGKYPAEWLKSLSNAELQSLHSDDHENKVQWQYVPAAHPVPAARYSACPPGQPCPYR